MNRKIQLLVVAWLAFWLAPRTEAEFSFLPVALSSQAAPGFGGATFSDFSCFALANDGQLVFTADATGTGVNSTNAQGVWAGTPGSLNLIARAGAATPGLNPDDTFIYFFGVNIGDDQTLAFLATLQGPGIDTNDNGGLWVAAVNPSQLDQPVLPNTNKVTGVVVAANALDTAGCNGEVLYYNTNTLACGVTLDGTGIDSSDNSAIIEGSYFDWSFAVRTGSPAPGTAGNFFSFDTPNKSLSPDGKVAFDAEDTVPGSGVWYGNSESLTAVAVPGGAAPFASGDTYNFFAGNEVEVNAADQLAFVMYLNGPTLNSTNSLFVVAGTPGSLRAVAQAGQPAPGVSGSYNTFGDVLIGSDGSVVFDASYTANGTNYGLWKAFAGGSPQLIASTGSQASGTPAGVVFSSSLPYLAPFENIFMNVGGQIAFSANLSGPGVNSGNNTGIWIVEANGSINLVARSGDTISAGGISEKLGQVSLSEVNTPIVAGPEDGRPTPFNDLGELMFSASINNTAAQGLFVVRDGLIMNAGIVGTNLLLTFPTFTNQTYQLDSNTTLTNTSWQILVPSIMGTGFPVTVTNGISSGAHYYKVERTD